MARRTLLLVLLSIFASTTAQAEWNIETPSSDISGQLTGEIFGNEFIFGDATWNSNCLIIDSKNKVAHMRAAKLFIFVKHDEEQSRWQVTPDSEDHPHIHVHFAKESTQNTNTLMYTSEYAMHLEVTERDEDSAKIQLHVSLPDYKHSFLIGEFKAEIQQ